MSTPGLTSRDVKAQGVLVPLARPIRTAVGTIPAAPLALIDVTTDQGIVGRAYVFAYTPVALPPLVRQLQGIGEETKGNRCTGPYLADRPSRRGVTTPSIESFLFSIYYAIMG